ncbi:hypothetical protein VHEMI01729 [[Torrubiella] hemipterigena]|uniref:Uncharacterized protein n=1 Tax=[Torrubiella] hemipterigena TaxID=1531966 RepID=A0A0A1T8D7_9HYPO|nr:hypothetical protein VHEMI01729 [[Torrubiella] hemipterigena]
MDLTVSIYANADNVHKMTKEGIHVWNGVRWNRLDEYDRIVGLDGRLMLAHSDSTIWRWIGPGIKWEQIDKSFENASFQSDPDGGLTIKKDRKNKYYRYLGEPFK